MAILLGITIFFICLGLLLLTQRDVLEEKLQLIQTTHKSKTTARYMPENYTIISSMIIIMLFYVIFLNIILSLIAGIIVFLFFPRFFEYYKKERLKKSFDIQMIKIINILSASLRSGATLYQGFEEAANTTTYPVNMELQKVTSDIQSGLSVEVAVQRLANVIQTPIAQLFADSLSLIQKAGSKKSLQLLENVAEAVQEQEYANQKIQTATSHIKTSFIICTILPFCMAGFMALMLPEYIKIFETLTGQVLIGASAAFIIIGWIMVFRIIKTAKKSA